MSRFDDLGAKSSSLIRPGRFQGGEHQHEHAVHPAGHSAHRWLMLICCIPMLAIAIALVVSGAVSVSFLLAALACPAMMFVMMREMHGGSR